METYKYRGQKITSKRFGSFQKVKARNGQRKLNGRDQELCEFCCERVFREKEGKSWLKDDQEGFVLAGVRYKASYELLWETRESNVCESD